MAVRTAKALMLVMLAPLILAAGGSDQRDFSVGPFNVPGAPRLYLGSVGLDSHVANSYLPAPGEAPYHFQIPSERPPPKAPGFLFRIPLGYDGPR